MGIDAWGWDRPLNLQAADAIERDEPGIFWAAHQVDLAYSQIERLVNLAALPPTGFTVACFPLKIVGGAPRRRGSSRSSVSTAACWMHNSLRRRAQRHYTRVLREKRIDRAYEIAWEWLVFPTRLKRGARPRWAVSSDIRSPPF